jgi:PAS domain-containing protein
MSQIKPTVACAELALRDPLYPDLPDALEYWERKRGARFAPARADIEPLDLVQVLPRIMLAEVAHDPVEFRYRLSGTGIGQTTAPRQRACGRATWSRRNTAR